MLDLTGFDLTMNMETRKSENYYLVLLALLYSYPVCLCAVYSISSLLFLRRDEVDPEANFLRQRIKALFRVIWYLQVFLSIALVRKLAP